jgi:hypothetical protein
MALVVVSELAVLQKVFWYEVKFLNLFEKVQYSMCA